MTYYKATRPGGTDFHTGTILYEVGATVTHPEPHRDDASGYLSVSTSEADCTGFSWPCRLVEVEPVDPWTPDQGTTPSKRACHALTVVRELEASRVFGPGGREVVAYLAQLAKLGSPARDAAWDAARDAAWDAARDAVWVAARDAVWDAARALAVRDLISNEHFDTLTAPMRAAGINFDNLGATVTHPEPHRGTRRYVIGTVLPGR